MSARLLEVSLLGVVTVARLVSGVRGQWSKD